MANIDLSVGQINITANLIARARKVATPLVEETREVYPAPLPSSFNVILPSSGSIDPTTYYVDFYESSDGIALDLLLAQFVVNARDNIVTEETRFYQVGGSQPEDPAPDQDTLTDPYLDGKTIAQVFKDGIGRPLVDEDYSFKEWELVIGGGIRLVGGQLFSFEEKVAIVISYLADQQQVSGAGMYEGVVTITSNTTLSSTHRNKRIRCAGGTTQLVITLEDVSSVPDGTFYHFTHNAGVQLQTKIIPLTTISYFNTVYAEMTIGPGEYLRVEKEGGVWEATMVHPGFLMVGERIAATWNDHPNTKPEDGALFDGDDYPRMWYWLTTFLPASHKVFDNGVTAGGYTHPVGKEGLFVLHNTLKKFRVPNTQGWSERGLASFSAFSTDGTRTYDYPGGTQTENVGAHRHLMFHDNGTSNTATPLSSINSPAKRQGAGAQLGNVNAEYNVCPSPGNEPDVGLSGTTTGENRVKNVGVIYLRRF